MEKVKVTKEQAEKIEWAKNYFKEDGLSRIVGLWMKNFSIWEPITGPLIGMKLDDLIRALYIGYEIEPEFNVGDWVVYIHDNTVCDVVAELHGGKIHYDITKNGKHVGSVHKDHLRKATPEEIKQEKERRWWASHGRGVWELKMGDTLINKNDRYSCDVKFVEGSDHTGTLLVNGRKDEFIELIEDLKKKYIVFCFEKDRLDLSN